MLSGGAFFLGTWVVLGTEHSPTIPSILLTRSEGDWWELATWWVRIDEDGVKQKNSAQKSAARTSIWGSGGATGGTLMWNTKCTSVHTEGAQIKRLCKHACVHGFIQYFPVYIHVTKKLAFIFHPSGIRLHKNNLLKINWTCYEQHDRVLSALPMSYVSL